MKPIIYTFFNFLKILLTPKKRLIGQQFLALNLTPHPTFSITGNTELENEIPSDTNWLKSSPNMYESSGTRFLRNTTGM